MGTYIAFVAASVAEAGCVALRQHGHLARRQWPDRAGRRRLVAVFAYGDIRAVTRSLLGLEGISVALIVVLVIVIFVKLATGDAPRQDFTVDIFKSCRHLAGNGRDRRGVRPLFRFRRCDGRDEQPRRNIPRAIFFAVVLAGSFYIVCIIAQTLGFGTDEAGVKAFGGVRAATTVTCLASGGLADAINLGATISAFAAALARPGRRRRGSRALGRDGSPPTGLVRRQRGGVGERARGRHRPGVTIVQRIIGPTRSTRWDIGVLAMLVAYIVTNVGDPVLLAARRAPL
jgi:hypothetical protein